MIKNVIFDYGDTLIRFDHDAMLAPHMPDPADRALAAPVVFDRLYWNRLDSGALLWPEAFEAIKTRLPERLWQGAGKTLEDWFFHVPEIPGMGALVKAVKYRYHRRLYLLSDVMADIAPYLGQLPILSEFDGYVLSGVVGVTKPNPAIYQHLTATYALKPEECLFVDNLPANVAGAERCGIRGYLFDGDVPRLAATLDILLNEP